MPIRWLLAAGLQVLLCGGLLAKELPADLRGLIEGFQSYRRVAIGYLRTQNVELGAVEIERLRERWARDRKAAEVAAQAWEGVADAGTSSLLDRALCHRVIQRGELRRDRVRHGRSEIISFGSVSVIAECTESHSARWACLDGFRAASNRNALGNAA
jgi:hypothetical protein